MILPVSLLMLNFVADITFTGGTCSGGHGLSIGSVGGRDDNTVKDVYFGSSTVSDSENGVRVKCSSGDTGAVRTPPNPLISVYKRR